MASIAISASLQRACNSHHVIKKQHSQTRNGSSLGAKQVTHVATVDIQSKNMVSVPEKQDNTDVHNHKAVHLQGAEMQGIKEIVESVSSFHDERWKNGTWDLNMFVKHGKMDWDSVILAEARRRKFLEVHPETTTNQDPVIFRSSIIPWWAWLMRTYLPEAELVNGRAAMVGFFIAYFVDVLTGLDVVGQTGNFICKAGLLVTIIVIILLRQTQDFGNLQKLVDEATLYDKQWQATWQDHSTINVSSKQDKNATN